MYMSRPLMREGSWDVGPNYTSSACWLPLPTGVCEETGEPYGLELGSSRTDVINEAFYDPGFILPPSYFYSPNISGKTVLNTHVNERFRSDELLPSMNCTV